MKKEAGEPSLWPPVAPEKEPENRPSGLPGLFEKGPENRPRGPSVVPQAAENLRKRRSDPE